MNVTGGLFRPHSSRFDTGKDPLMAEVFSVPAVLSAVGYFSGYGMQEVLNELLAFSRQLSIASTVEELSAEIAQRAAEFLQATFSAVLMALPNHTLECTALVDHRDVTSMDQGAHPLDSPCAMKFYQQQLHHFVPQIYHHDSPALSEVERHFLGLSNGARLCLAPMRLDSETIGLLVVGQTNEHKGQAGLEGKIRLISFLAEQSAAALYRVSLSRRLRENQLETVVALAKALEARDPHTAGHGERMTEMSVKLSALLDVPPIDHEIIGWAALLHDIGKIGISDEILRKNGPLTPGEWTMMKRHPRIGAEIVMNVSNLAGVADLIHAHHERFDGQGYPRGLAGASIPLGARIIAVADTYSAMTDGRVYRPRCTHDEALAELKRCAGRQYDPKIVDLFLRIYS